jgi:hypothetical protein
MSVFATGARFGATVSFIVFSALATPASAEGLKISDPDSNVEFLTAPMIGEMLTQLGASDVQLSEEGKNKLIKFKDVDKPLLIALVGCDVKPEGCLGMVMFAGMDPGTTKYPLESFNAFNQKQNFVTSFKLDDNKYAVTRLVISEGGVTKKNLAVNIVNFAAAPNEIMKFLNSQIVAGLQEGNPQFQTASLSVTPSRVVALAPLEIAKFVASIQMPNAKGLQKRQ